MKTMAGECFRATRKRSRIRAAATPSNISTNSEPLAEKKATLEDPAMALARYVFPVPGGPSSKIPCTPRTHSIRYIFMDTETFQPASVKEQNLFVTAIQPFKAVVLSNQLR